MSGRGKRTCREARPNTGPEPAEDEESEEEESEEESDEEESYEDDEDESDSEGQEDMGSESGTKKAPKWIIVHKMSAEWPAEWSDDLGVKMYALKDFEAEGVVQEMFRRNRRGEPEVVEVGNGNTFQRLEEEIDGEANFLDELEEVEASLPKRPVEIIAIVTVWI